MFINYFVAYIPSWTIRKLFYRAVGMKIGKGSRIKQVCIYFLLMENTVIS